MGHRLPMRLMKWDTHRGRRINDADVDYWVDFSMHCAGDFFTG
jgi:hypothetical protein